MSENIYYRQARLLLKIIPLINALPDFAIKGGTAINFFVRNLPRLSVDIDLTYLPVRDREQSLHAIAENLELLSDSISRKSPDIDIVFKRNRETNRAYALVPNQAGVTVKIEPNLVVRGSVFPGEKMRLCRKAEDKFNLTMNANLLSLADLYGSKICAALDRQHPRDLFDVYLLLKNEGITKEIRKAFIVYLISHPRPIVELLDPNPQHLGEIYYQEFRGMTFQDVSLQTLAATRHYLASNIVQLLSEQEKRFLITFKSLNPDWALLGLENVETLPGVKWKLVNLDKMPRNKHRRALDKLRKRLDV